MNSLINARYMLRAAFLATLLASTQPAVAAGDPFSGQLQQGYGEMMDPEATQGMACRLREVAGEWSIHFVGVDLAAHPDACGRCITLRCTDAALCAGGGEKNVTAAVVDDCPGCGNGVRSSSFIPRELSGGGAGAAGSLPVQWGFADCGARGQIVPGIAEKTQEPAPPGGEPSVQQATAAAQPQAESTSTPAPEPAQPAAPAPTAEEPDASPSPAPVPEPAAAAPLAEVAQARQLEAPTPEAALPTPGPASEPASEPAVEETQRPAPQAEQLPAPAEEPARSPAPSAEEAPRQSAANDTAPPAPEALAAPAPEPEPAQAAAAAAAAAAAPAFEQEQAPEPEAQPAPEPEAPPASREESRLVQEPAPAPELEPAQAQQAPPVPEPEPESAPPAVEPLPPAEEPAQEPAAELQRQSAGAETAAPAPEAEPAALPPAPAAPEAEAEASAAGALPAVEPPRPEAPVAEDPAPADEGAAQQQPAGFAAEPAGPAAEERPALDPPSPEQQTREQALPFVGLASPAIEATSPAAERAAAPALQPQQVELPAPEVEQAPLAEAPALAAGAAVDLVASKEAPLPALTPAGESQPAVDAIAAPEPEAEPSQEQSLPEPLNLGVIVLPLLAVPAPEVEPPAADSGQSQAPAPAIELPRPERPAAILAGALEVEPAAEAADAARTTASQPRSATVLQGQASPAYYEPFPADKLKTLACGFGALSPHFTTHFAGVNLGAWSAAQGGSSAAACGSCAAVRCVDAAACAAAGGRQAEIVVQVVDDCGSCGQAGINLAPAALRELTGNGYRPQAVAWAPAPCRGLTQGDIHLEVLPGGNAWYRQLALSNAAQPVAAVEINGQRLRQEASGRWVWENSGKELAAGGPVRVKVTGSNGAVVEASLPELASGSLGAQL